MVAFLLDAAIRRATTGGRSLDDLMREAYRHYSGARGFTPDEFRALAERVAGTDLGAFWRSAIEGTNELDYTDALGIFGLRFRPITTRPGDRPKTWLGATTRVDAGRLLVAQVRRDTPAFRAGLNVDDEILAIDEVRVRADRLDERLEQYAPGDRATVLVARRDRVLSLDVILGAESPKLAPGILYRVGGACGTPLAPIRIREKQRLGYAYTYGGFRPRNQRQVHRIE